MCPTASHQNVCFVYKLEYIHHYTLFFFALTSSMRETVCFNFFDFLFKLPIRHFVIFFCLYLIVLIEGWYDWIWFWKKHLPEISWDFYRHFNHQHLINLHHFLSFIFPFSSPIFSSSKGIVNNERNIIGNIVNSWIYWDKVECVDDKLHTLILNWLFCHENEISSILN